MVNANCREKKGTIRSQTTGSPNMSSFVLLGSSPLPSLPLCTQRASPLLHILSKLTTTSTHKGKPRSCGLSAVSQTSQLNKLGSLLHYGAVLASVHAPAALAVTGNNNEEDDLLMTVVAWGIVAVLYFLVTPPILFNWMRLRWYKRKFFEMYFQFMCVFLFFPGMMLWAPFLNFRKFPRDPTMKNPWDTPKADVPLYKIRRYE